MIATLNDKALVTILEIINRGNQAVIRRTGKGVVVMEETRKVKYSDTPPKLDGR